MTFNRKPNPNSRWCTRKLKLAPFEEWVRPMLAVGDKVTSYVAIRAEENRPKSTLDFWAGALDKLQAILE